MFLPPVDVVFQRPRQISAERLALLRGKAAQHDLLHLRALGHPRLRRFQTSVCYRQEVATAVAFIGGDGDEATLLQRFRHPRDRCAVYLEIIRQFLLAAGAVRGEIGDQLGLPRAQSQRAHVGAEDVALGVEGAVEQHVHGFLHALPSFAAFLVDISTVDMSIITKRKHLSRHRALRRGKITPEGR